MSEVIIRHWQDGDDERVFELFDRTERWLSNEDYMAKFGDEGLAPEGIIIAAKDGLIIGHLMGTRTEIMCEGEAKLFGGIGQVMVDENFRGRGIGKEMLTRIIQYHTDNGCRGILLWTQDYRFPAYPMYEKFGFRIAARRAFYQCQPEINTSTLVVEPYTDKFAEQTEEMRLEWMRISFPVGIGNMKLTDGNWFVVHENHRVMGYVHVRQKDESLFLSHAVARLADAPEVCEALFKFIKELGHADAVWQTCIGSIWAEELQKRGVKEGNITGDVRMCLAIGPPIETHGQRPEFDGCSTW